ncbi:MAG: DoxX family protein [Bacteroidota bacterium]
MLPAFISLVSFTDPIVLARLLGAAFLAILFLQSGLDKVFDWKGNLGWLQGHFANSPLKSIVKPMLGTVTLIELAAGLLSAAGMIMVVIEGKSTLAFYGATLSGLALLMLFFGQRLAKDYAGAATLVSYFILSLGCMWLQSIPAW